jgi:hypothetical protein
VGVVVGGVGVVVGGLGEVVGVVVGGTGVVVVVGGGAVVVVVGGGAVVVVGRGGEFEPGPGDVVVVVGTPANSQGNPMSSAGKPVRLFCLPPDEVAVPPPGTRPFLSRWFAARPPDRLLVLGPAFVLFREEGPLLSPLAAPGTKAPEDGESALPARAASATTPCCATHGLQLVRPTIEPTTMSAAAILPRTASLGPSLPNLSEAIRARGGQRKRLTGIARNARTTAGSNCEPANRASFARAASGKIGPL